MLGWGLDTAPLPLTALYIFSLEDRSRRVLFIKVTANRFWIRIHLMKVSLLAVPGGLTVHRSGSRGGHPGLSALRPRLPSNQLQSLPLGQSSTASAGPLTVACEGKGLWGSTAAALALFAALHTCSWYVGGSP